MAWALRKARLVVAVSNELRELAIELGVRPDRTFLSVNGVDNNRFYPRDRVSARQKHGILPQQFAILSAGHLIPLKGHQHVIRAVRTLVDRQRNIRLLIAGGPGTGVLCNEHSLRELVAALSLNDHVQFLGPVEQESMPELMSAADLLCLASEREGSPNVVHEALACGTPVIATSVGAVDDILNSDIGVVLNRENLSALADVLDKALERNWDRRTIAELGGRRSWDTVARELLAAIGGVARD